MSDVAQKGLSAFLRLLAERQAGDMPAAVPNGAETAALKEQKVLTEEDQKALVELAADMSAGCSQEAAATVPPTVPSAPKGLLGLAGGIVQRAWEVPGTFLGIRAAVRKLAGGASASGSYR